MHNVIRTNKIPVSAQEPKVTPLRMRHCSITSHRNNFNYRTWRQIM